MQGGAVTLNRLLRERNLHPDLILASDMMDVSTFRALAADHLQNTPVVTYFHETQLTYPQNRRQAHGWRYGFINYVSALASDWSYFNSQYHRDTFLNTLPNMLKHFGDFNELDTVEQLRTRSSVLALGLDLHHFDTHQPNTRTSNTPPIILWNHRWETDKNPITFFRALYKLADQNIPFQVAITGENIRRTATEFEEARHRLGDRIIQYGYLPNFADYARLLWRSDYVVSTSHQDFFGGSIAQAIYCGCIPILPNRLNYPHLLPAEAHQQCLYKGEALYALLKDQLHGSIAVDTKKLRKYISQFDWSVLAQHYDDTFDALLQ